MDAFYNIKNEVAELENRKIIRPRHLTEKLPIVKAHLSIRANNLLVSLNKSPMNMTEVAQRRLVQQRQPRHEDRIRQRADAERGQLHGR